MPRTTLKGGPISAAEIVDAYINANRALFGVKKNLKADMDAARLLNISEDAFDGALDRLSNVEVNSIDEGLNANSLPGPRSLELRDVNFSAIETERGQNISELI